MKKYKELIYHTKYHYFDLLEYCPKESTHYHIIQQDQQILLYEDLYSKKLGLGNYQFHIEFVHTDFFQDVLCFLNFDYGSLVVFENTDHYKYHMRLKDFEDLIKAADNKLYLAIPILGHWSLKSWHNRSTRIYLRLDLSFKNI